MFDKFRASARKDTDLIGEGALHLTWRRFRRHRRGMTGLIALLLMLLGVTFVPYLLYFHSPASLVLNGDVWEPSNPDPNMWYAPALTYDPSTGHIYLLGSDSVGRDLIVRAFSAGRVTLGVVTVSTLLFVLIGVIIGSIAGYFGGWVDNVLMRFVDIMLSFPLLPALLLTMRGIKNQFWGGGLSVPDPVLTLGATALVFVLFGWMGISRLVRSAILRLRTMGYIEAARALGQSDMRIITKHLIPNAAAPILVATTFALGDFVVWESIVAYFRQGITDPPIHSWGTMLQGSLENLQFITNLNPFVQIRPYIVLLPIFLIFVTVLSFNYVAEGLYYAFGLDQVNA